MQQFIINLFLALVKALFGAFTPKMQEGAKPGELEERLKAKAKKDGWK